MMKTKYQNLDEMSVEEMKRQIKSCRSIIDTVEDWYKLGLIHPDSLFTAALKDIRRTLLVNNKKIEIKISWDKDGQIMSQSLMEVSDEK